MTLLAHSFVTVCTLTTAAALGLASTASASPMTAPKLYGTVGPGYTITLKQHGKLVRTLHRGVYMFVVSDGATNHDFTIEGERVGPTVITGDGFTGTKTVTLVLKRGTYTYYCALHEPVMHHTFRVV